MFVSPISTQQINVKRNNLKNTKKQNVSFQGKYSSEIYEQFCRKSPDFRYKVPQKIFKLLDELSEMEYGIEKYFSEVSFWQKVQLPNDRLEHIGIKDNKVRVIRRGIEPLWNDFDANMDIWNDYVAVFDRNSNKFLELEYKIPSRPAHGGGLTKKKDFYNNCEIVEFETSKSLTPTPWINFTINHYSPYGVNDKSYHFYESYMNTDSTLEAKNLISGITDKFSCLINH